MANKRPLVLDNGRKAELSTGDTLPVNILETLSTLRAVVTDNNGKLSVSAVTNTELGYLTGVTSAIQTQLNSKQPLDADLTAIAAITGTGFLKRTGVDTWVLDSSPTSVVAATLAEVQARTNTDKFVNSLNLATQRGKLKTFSLASLPTSTYTDGSLVESGDLVALSDGNRNIKRWNSTVSQWITSDNRYNVLDFGLKGDNSTDNTSAWDALKAILPDGAIVLFPKGFYKGNFSFSSVTAKGITVEGEGWSTENADYFGASSWNSTGSVKGTVLIQYLDTQNTVSVTYNSFVNQIHFRKLAILGKGTGTKAGLEIGPAASARYIIDDVFIANHYVGFKADGIEETNIYLNIMGCRTGTTITDNNSNMTLFVQCSSYRGIEINGGVGNKIFGLVQACTGDGIVINSGESNTISNIYIENAGITNSIVINGGSENVFDNIHFSDNHPVLFAGGTNTKFINTRSPSVPYTSTGGSASLVNTTHGTITDVSGVIHIDDTYNGVRSLGLSGDTKENLRIYGRVRADGANGDWKQYASSGGGYWLQFGGNMRRLAVSDSTYALKLFPDFADFFVDTSGNILYNKEFQLSDVSSNSAKLNAFALTIGRIYGGTNSNSTLTLAGTSNVSPSNAHIYLNSSEQGKVYVGGTAGNGRFNVNTSGFSAVSFSNTDTSTSAYTQQAAVTIYNSSNTTNNWTGIQFGNASGAITSGISAQTYDHTNMYGNVYIHTRATDGFSEKFRFGTVNVSSRNLLPDTDLNRDLGSTSFRWNNIYAQNFVGAVTPTGFTAGSVVFAGTGGALSQDNTNFFWENSNKRLGINTASPQKSLHVNGDARFGASSWLDFIDAGSANGRFVLGGTAAIDFTTALLFRNAAGTTEFARFNSSGYLGIGTNNPQQILHVAANGQPTVLVEATAVSNVAKVRIKDFDNGDFSLQVGLGSLTGFSLYDNTATTTRIFVDGNGNTGFGTTAPKTTVDVNGAISRVFNSGAGRLYTNIFGYTSGNASDTGTFKIAIPSAARWSNTMIRLTITGYNYSGNNAGTGGAWEAIVSGYNYSGTNTWTNCSAEISGSAPFNTIRLADDGTNNVILLGNTSTTWTYAMISITALETRHLLPDSWGATWTGSFITSETGITNIVTPVLRSVAYTSGSGGLAYVNGGNSFGADASIGLNDAYSLTVKTSNVERIKIASGGNIGINMNGAAPSQTVHIKSSSIAAVRFDNGTNVWDLYGVHGGSNGAFVLTDQTNTRTPLYINPNSKTHSLYINSTGVGVGTASPSSTFHIYDPTVGISNAGLSLEGAGGGYGAGISFKSMLASTSTLAEMARITADGEASWNATASTQNAGLRFFTSNLGTVAEKMRLDTTGNLGIGQTNPTFKLDVTGTGRFTGAVTLGTQASTTAHAVRADRAITAGTGLSGGGDLTADRTLSIDYTNSNIRKYNKLINITASTDAAGDYWDLWSVASTEPSSIFEIYLNLYAAGVGSTRKYTFSTNFANEPFVNNTWYRLTAIAGYTRNTDNLNIEVIAMVNNNTISFRLLIVTPPSAFPSNNYTANISLIEPSNYQFSGTVTSLSTTGTGMTVPTAFIPANFATYGGGLVIGQPTVISTSNAPLEVISPVSGAEGIRITRSNAAAQYLSIHQSGGSAHTLEAFGEKPVNFINKATSASGNFGFYWYTDSTNQIMSLGRTGTLGIGVNPLAGATAKLDVAGIINSSQEYRLGNYSYSRVAVMDSSGGFFGGYNVKGDAVPATGIVRDSLGSNAAIWINTNGIRLYTDTSGASAGSVTLQLTLDNSGHLILGRESNIIKGTNINLIRQNNFAYNSNAYKSIQLGSGNSISLGVDTSSISGSTFSGTNELIIPNAYRINQVNSGGTDFLPNVLYFNNSNVGVGNTALNFKLEVAGHVGPNSDATYDLGSVGLRWRNGYFSGTVYSPNGYWGSSSSPVNIELQRTLPTAVNDYIEIGNCFIANGAQNLRITATISTSSFSVSKQYLVSANYNQTSNTWNILSPIRDTAAYAGNNFDIDINVNNATLNLRLRKSLGTLAGALCYIRIENIGASTASWTSTTATGTATLPTSIFGTFYNDVTNNRFAIGTISPVTSNFTVVGTSFFNTISNGFIYQSTDNGNGRITLGANNGYGAITSTTSAGAVAFQLLNAGDNRLLGVNNADFTFYTNNTEKMRLTAGGILGIGNTSLDSTTVLDIEGAGTGNSALLLRNGDASTVFTSAQIKFGYANTNGYAQWIATRHNAAPASNAIDFYTSDGTANTVFGTNTIHGITVTNGKLGVATTNPGYRVTVNATQGTVGLGVINLATSNDIALYGSGIVTGNLNLLYSDISATGNVSAVANNTNTSSSTANANLEAKVGGASAGDPYMLYTISGVQNWVTGIDNSDSDKFKIIPSASPSSGTPSITIDTSGNVGIGESNPQQALHIKTATNYQGILINGNSAPSIGFARTTTTTPEWKVGVSGSSGSQFAISTGAANTDLLTMTTGGNVGIGVLTASEKLEVAGAIKPTGNGSQVGYYLPANLAIRSGTAGTYAYLDLGNAIFRDGNGVTGAAKVHISGGATVGSGFSSISPANGELYANTIKADTFDWGGINVNFGQRRYKISEFNDLFWQADKRFTVTNGNAAYFDGDFFSGGTALPANTTTVININVVNQSGVPSAGVTYLTGKIYVSFYSTNHKYTACTLRFKYNGNSTPVWSSALTPTNISINNNYKVLEFSLAGQNYLTDVEISVTTDGVNTVRIASINYYLDIQESVATEPPYFSKYLNTNRFYGALAGFTNANLANTLISNTGNSYFAAATGNVGIGTTAPSSGFKLTINSATSAQGLLINNTAASGQARILLQGGTGGVSQIDSNIGDFYLTNNSSTGSLVFRAGSSVERMRILSGGNVGIGLQTPATKLDISTSNTVNYWNGTNWGGSTIPPQALTITNSANEGYDVPLLFRMATSTGVLKTTAAINIANAGAWSNGSVSSQVSDMLFIVGDNTGALVRRLTISYTGNSNFSGSLSVNGATVITGSGTTTALPKFSGTNAIVSSIVYDTGTKVGINQSSPNSTFHITGSRAQTISFVSASTYTVLDTDGIIAVDTTSNEVTLTLPTAASCAGRIYLIKDWKGNSSTNFININTTSSQLIDGAVSIVIMNAYDKIEIQSDGTNWMIIG